MAIIDVKEDWSKRTYQIVGKVHTAVRGFTVTFDDSSDPVEEPILAANASVIPEYGDFHPNLEAMSVKDIIVPPGQGPHLLEVLVNYKGTTQNILDEPDVVSYFFFTSEEPIDRDKEGKAITNSAGEQFDPPITKKFYDLGIRIRSYEGSFNEDTAAAAIGKINTSSFRGHSTGEVMCTDYSGTPQWNNGFLECWVVNKEYRVRTDGWEKRLLDVGFRVTSGDGILPEPSGKQIKDSSGNGISEPVLLDGSGGLAPAGSTGVFLEFDIY